MALFVATFLRLFLFSFFGCLFFPLLDHLPVINPCSSNLHGLALVSRILRFPGAEPIGRTVICSRKKSRSSSQLAKLVLAVDSLLLSSVSASPMGYDNITLACAWSTMLKSAMGLLAIILPAKCRLPPWVEYLPSHRASR